MKWSKYYENVFDDWSVEMMISQISKLADIGTQEEVMDVLYEIGYVNKEGASKLLDKALEFSMKFSVENLSEIQELCSEVSFRRALEQVAPGFTKKDLEEMYDYFDDDLIIELVKKYGITAPQEIADQYEEQLDVDLSAPISWERFYNNFTEWSVEYAKQKAQNLTDFGSEDQIMDVVSEIFDGDTEGASAFIRRAAAAGVRFGADNINELSFYCDGETMRRIIVVPGTKTSDLDKMYGNVDDELIIEAVNKLGIPAPREMEGVYEEQICPDASTPISWDRFYENYSEWSSVYAKQRCRSLTEYGSDNQIIEIAENLFYENQGEADGFIERAVEAGVDFGVESLLEISALCSEKTTNIAFDASIDRLTREDLEALRCGIDDDVIIETAKKHHHDLPQSLKEIDPEEISKDELKCYIEMAVESADYALQCLYQTQTAMNMGSNASLIDMLSKSRGASFFKHLALGDAEQELRIASEAVVDLNQKLSYISGNQYVKLHYERLTSAVSLWFDDDFLNCLIHLQIGKVKKNIRRAISRVEDVRRELAVLWDDMT